MVFSDRYFLVFPLYEEIWITKDPYYGKIFVVDPKQYCLKVHGSYSGLILTSWKHSFKYLDSYKTGISGSHHLIYTIFKRILL